MCKACDQRKWDELADEHEADTLAAEYGGTTEATDAEWWSWVMEGGRD